MKSLSRARPSVEALEDRSCPAVTANAFGSLLVVRGTPAGAVSVTQTANGSFTVTDGVTNASFTGINDVLIKFRNGNDNVSVNLGTSTLGGSVLAYLGSGNNTFNINTGAGGTIGGGVYYAGLSGVDNVGVATGVTINGVLGVYTGSNNDTVAVGQATIKGGAFFGLGSGNDGLTLDAAVGTGTGWTFLVDAGSGNDSATIGATASITGTAKVNMGSGTDTFNFNDAATLTGTLKAKGGSGADTYIGTLPRTGVTTDSF